MSQTISIMPCLDMQNGRVVKGVHFVDIADAGDPVECARAYCAAGADELAMLDITATVENRPTLAKVVREVAAVCTVPFTVGGGINDIRAAANVLEAGADKVSVSSAAYRRPELITEIIREFGPALRLRSIYRRRTHRDRHRRARMGEARRRLWRSGDSADQQGRGRRENRL